MNRSLPKYLFRRSRSDVIYCQVKVWDPQRDQFIIKEQTTKTKDPAIAEKVRAELQAVADLARSSSDSTMTRAAAFKAVNEILKWSGVPEISDTVIKTVPTWNDYSADWLTDQLAIKGETATFRQYRSQCSLFATYHGEKQLTQITRKECQEFYNEIFKQRESKTCKNIMACIRRVFNQAIDDDLITKNPAAKVKQAVVVERQDDPFTPEDIKKIINGIKQFDHPDEWKIVISFGLCLGMRFDDSTRMKREYFDFSNDIPIISYIPAKTARHGEKARVIAPVVDPLLSLIKPIQTDLLTPNLATTKINWREGLSNQFMDLLLTQKVPMRTEQPKGKAGRTWNSKGFHSFRHTLPTLLAESGCPTDMRKAILGHSSGGDIHARYTHHNLAQMQDFLTLALQPFQHIK